MSQYNLRYVPTLACNEFMLNGQSFNTQSAIIYANGSNVYTPALTTQVIINDATKNQALYANILTLEGEISGNVNPNLVIVDARLTALEGNVSILQGNVIFLQSEINVINSNIANINANINGLNANTQYLHAPYNGLGGNTSYFTNGLQVWNGANETGNGIFSYIDGASPANQIRLSVQNAKGIFLDGGSTTIAPTSGGNVNITGSGGTAPFNFVVKNPGLLNANIRMAGDVEIAGNGNSSISIFTQPASLIPPLPAIDYVNIRGGGQAQILGPDINIQQDDGGTISIGPQSAGSTNSTINIGTSQGLANTGYQVITIGSGGATQARNSSTFLEGDNYLPYVAATNTGLWDGIAYVGLPTVYSGPLHGPLKTTYTPYVKSISTYFAGSTINSFVSTAGTFVVGVGIGAISLTCGAGGFLCSTGAGLLALTTLAGGITMSTVAGAISITTAGGALTQSLGAGAFTSTTGSGIQRLQTSSADIQIAAGYAPSGTSGDVVITAKGNISVSPDVGLYLEKVSHMATINNGTTPPGLPNYSLYTVNSNLYYNGTIISGSGGGVTQIISGNGITVSPTQGTGVVTVSAIGSYVPPGGYLPVIGGNMVGDIYMQNTSSSQASHIYQGTSAGGQVKLYRPMSSYQAPFPSIGPPTYTGELLCFYNGDNNSPTQSNFTGWFPQSLVSSQPTHMTQLIAGAGTTIYSLANTNTPSPYDNTSCTSFPTFTNGVHITAGTVYISQIETTKPLTLTFGYPDGTPFYATTFPAGSFPSSGLFTFTLDYTHTLSTGQYTAYWDNTTANFSLMVANPAIKTNWCGTLTSATASYYLMAILSGTYTTVFKWFPGQNTTEKQFVLDGSVYGIQEQLISTRYLYFYGLFNTFIVGESSSRVNNIFAYNVDSGAIIILQSETALLQNPPIGTNGAVYGVEVDTVNDRTWLWGDFTYVGTNASGQEPGPLSDVALNCGCDFTTTANWSSPVMWQGVGGYCNCRGGKLLNYSSANYSLMVWAGTIGDGGNPQSFLPFNAIGMNYLQVSPYNIWTVAVASCMLGGYISQAVANIQVIGSYLFFTGSFNNGIAYSSGNTCLSIMYSSANQDVDNTSGLYDSALLESYNSSNTGFWVDNSVQIAVSNLRLMSNNVLVMNTNGYGLTNGGGVLTVDISSTGSLPTKWPITGMPRYSTAFIGGNDATKILLTCSLNQNNFFYSQTFDSTPSPTPTDPTVIAINGAKFLVDNTAMDKIVFAGSDQDYSSVSFIAGKVEDNDYNWYWQAQVGQLNFFAGNTLYANVCACPPQPYVPGPTTSTWAQVLINGNIASKSIDMSSFDIMNANTIYSANILTLSAPSGINLSSSSSILLTAGSVKPTLVLDNATNSNIGVHFGNTNGNMKYSSNLSYNPSTTTLNCPNIIGNITGTITNATTAANIATTGTSANVSYHIPFVSANATTSSQAVYTDALGHLTFNPSSNQLSASGTMTNNGMIMYGSASQILINNNSAVTPAISGANVQLVSLPLANITATTFTGNVSRITTTSDNTSGTYYIPFSKTTAVANTQLFLDDTTTALTYNPNISTLTASTFSGNLSGTATTATTATNATNTTITSIGVSSSFYPTFVSATTGNLTHYVNGNLNYNPATSTLSVPSITGNITNINTTSDNTNGTYYIPFSKTTAVANTQLFLDDTTTALTYNPATSTITSGNIIVSASSSTNTITSSQIAVANAGGTLTLNQGSFTGSPTSGAYIFNGASGLRLQYNGTNNLFTTTNAVQTTLLTSQGTATYSSPTLTLVTTAADPYPTLYTNLITFSGSTVAQTISAITVPTNMPINGMYMVYITNNNTSLGAITVNATTLGTGIKTTYTTNVVIPISGFALGTLTKVGSANYIWSINLVA